MRKQGPILTDEILITGELTPEYREREALQIESERRWEAARIAMKKDSGKQKERQRLARLKASHERSRAGLRAQQQSQDGETRRRRKKRRAQRKARKANR